MTKFYVSFSASHVPLFVNAPEIGGTYTKKRIHVNVKFAGNSSNLKDNSALGTIECAVNSVDYLSHNINVEIWVFMVCVYQLICETYNC